MTKEDTYKMFASKMREDLYRSLKLLSAVEDKPIQKLLEEAVTKYLDGREFTQQVSENSVTYFSVRQNDPESKKDKSKK